MGFITADGYKNYVRKYIEEYINENGKLPSKKDIANKNVSIEPLVSMYGGWTNILKALGFDNSSVEESINSEDVMSKIKALHVRLGVVPTLSDLKNENINVKAIQSEFGAWNNIKKMLKGEINEEEMLELKDKKEVFDINEEKEKLISLTNELGSVPQIKQAQNKGIKVAKILRMFGNWTNAKRELGLYKLQEQTVLNEIKKLQKDEAIRPTLKKIKKEKINIYPLLKEHGNWKNVCNVLNIPFYNLNKIENDILDVAMMKEATPTATELKKEYKININPLIKEHGSWSKVVEKMNLNSFKDNKTMEAIQAVSDKLDRTPTLQDLRDSDVKLNGILTRYKGWNNLRKHMGLPVHSKYSNTELKEKEDALLELGNKLKRTPTFKEVANNNLQIYPLINRYGSWNNLLFKLGFKQNTRLTDEAIDKLTIELQDLATKLGKSPTMKEAKAHNIAISPLQRKFGSFGECLLSVGLKPRHLSKKSYNQEAILEELRALTDKLGKVPSMKVAINHGIKTNRLKKELGGWAKVRETILNIETPILMGMQEEVKFA